VKKREFEQWEMGFANLDTVEISKIPGYTNYLNEPFNSKRFTDASFVIRSLRLNAFIFSPHSSASSVPLWFIPSAFNLAYLATWRLIPLPLCHCAIVPLC